MIKKYILIFLLLLPTTAFSASGGCSSVQLSDFLMHEKNIIVSFKVIDSQFLPGTGIHFIELEISREFYSNKITKTILKIDTENEFGPALSSFAKNVEWLTVITQVDDFYVIAGCAPRLIIENDMVVGETGIAVLDKLETEVSVEMLDLVLGAFQQGIS